MVDHDEGNTGSRDSLPEQICSPGVGWRSEEFLTILLRRKKDVPESLKLQILVLTTYLWS